MIIYFKHLWNLFLYAGVEKQEYGKLIPSVRRENDILLNVFAPLAGVMFFLLFIVSMITNGFATVNSSTYLICGVLMGLLLICEKHLAPRHPALVMVLVYVFEIVLYAFGIRISMLHADNPAVSAVAFLLVSPLLFYDRPVRLSALIAAVVAVFCVMARCFKQPMVAETDVWNMITFGIVAIVTTVFIMSVKYRALSQSRKIEYLSQTDLMTGTKNRNHYENQLKAYPRICKSGIICVYGDVNGLHEMNYKEGHEAGDRMLREVAASMQRYFGPEHTYRIGGDEFAAFRVDGRREEVLSDIDRISRELDEEGYHISFGIAAQDKAQGDVDMHALVKEAEMNMFAAKQEFYRKPENNRRNR